MPKNINKTTVILNRFKVGAMLALGVLLVVGSIMPRGGQDVLAATATCSSITECNNQIAANNSAVRNLEQEAVSYQDAIARLNSQIRQLQNQINYNRARQAKLERQIAHEQAQIQQQKIVLGDVLRSMYVDGQMSTIEMIATSNNLSDYVDKEEYRNMIQGKIQDALVEIAKLQQQLQVQKAQVEELIREERAQSAQLVTARSKQNKMLSYNKSQRASYNAQTAANQSKLAALIAAQRAANQSSSPGGYYFLRFPGTARDFNGNNYPYKYSGFSMSTAPGCNDGDGPDPWGYCTRQCVSYAAWAVKASGRDVPMYYGSAKNWVYAARRDGVPIYSNPQPGDVAISTKGTWGHAMYVEAVSGNQIYVSQYNQQLTGQYSTQWRTYR